MVQRWAAAGFLDAAKSFRKLIGYEDQRMLDAILNPSTKTPCKAA